MKSTTHRTTPIVSAITLIAALLLSSLPTRASQSPLGCSANNLNVNIGVLANNVTNGTMVTWFVTVQNPLLPDSCDVTLGPDGLYFLCPGADGNPTGTRTTLIPGGTTLPPGYGLTNFNITCLVNVTTSEQQAVGKVSAPGSVVHKNPLQDDPANVDKTISVNLFRPCINLKAQCVSAVNSTGNGVVVTYTGTVNNCGNIFLQNVLVYSDKPFPDTLVFGPVTLAAGATTNFTVSYTSFDNLCGPFVTGLTVSGVAPTDVPSVVTSAASSTCTIAYNPAIKVTKVCPPNPVQPGEVLVISGVVSNAGNIGLQNVMVVNNQPSANTPLLGPITLAVGEAVAYTGSYTVPLDSCPPYNDTVTAQGTPVCGTQTVSSSATASCAGANSPSIRVTQACPVAPVTPGGTLTYTGTVTNTGNVTLTNVVVVSDKPVANTRVFGPVNLAPGAGGAFTASYVVPVNSCGPYADTVVATGRDKCFGNTATDSSLASCPGTTTPGIKVSMKCPTSPVQPGGTLNYTGTVTNTGNIALANVTVYNGSTLIYGPASLNPGAGASFSASYAVPTDSCGPYVSTLFAQGQSLCNDVAQDNVTVACAGANTPSIRVSAACPTAPVPPGGLLTYTGTVTNTGNISLTNVMVLNSQPSAGTPVFGPVTLAPGEGAVFTGSYVVPVDSCGPYVDTLTATGADQCFGKAVTSAATATCPGVSTPGIVISQQCPPEPAAIGGTLTFTATVVNTGDITLTNIVVVNNRPAAGTVVLRVSALAPGQSTNFTAGFTVPANLNSCSIDNTLNVTGINKCSGAAVTNGVATTCPVVSAPGIKVVKVCPTVPPQTGSLLTYSGTVMNTGNVTLTNVSVISDQPVPGTVVFTTGSLAPGASAAFSGSYQSPADTCSVTDTLAASATDLCGNLVSNSTTTTCPLATTAGLVITSACPDGAVPPGAPLVFTGTITNTGNVTLKDVTVVVDHPAPNTPVYGPTTLAPGQSASFSGSFLVPTNLNSCNITSLLSAHGTDNCTGAGVSASASKTCPVLTTPNIQVTKTCPANPVAQGATLTFTGTVVNMGNITLKDIVVVNDMPASNTVVFRAVSLAPGQSTNFTGSYKAPTNCCSVTDTLLASGTDICTGTVVTDTSSAICPVIFHAAVSITKVCPTTNSLPGQPLTYTGLVSNTGDITLEDVLVYSSMLGEQNPVLGVFNLAPGEVVPYTATFIVPIDYCDPDTINVKALSLCGNVTVTDSVTSACPVTTTPGIALSRTCPAQPILKGQPVTFTATVVNTGNVTLLNVTVVDSLPAPGTVVLGPITLGPGQSTNFTFTYVTPLDCNCCALVDTLKAQGQDRCANRTVSATSTTVCPYETHPQIAVTLDCPTQAGGVGSVVTFTGMVMNMGDTTLSNVVVMGTGPAADTRLVGPITLARGEFEEFSGSYVVTETTPGLSTLGVTATGADPCNGFVVSDSANCQGVTPPSQPLILSIVINGSNLTLTWTSQTGVTYRVQSRPTLKSGTWQDESGDVVAQGATASKTLAVPAGQGQYFYRIMVVQ